MRSIVVGTLFASHQKILFRARSSGATLKIFAHKKYASTPLDIQDENKIILPIILRRRGMQIEDDERTYTRTHTQYMKCIFAAMNYCKWLFISIYSRIFLCVANAVPNDLSLATTIDDSAHFTCR
jgi:hypothetical protein